MLTENNFKQRKLTLHWRMYNGRVGIVNDSVYCSWSCALGTINLKVPE